MTNTQCYLDEFYLINHTKKEYVYVNVNTVDMSFESYINSLLYLLNWSRIDYIDINDIDTLHWQLANMKYDKYNRLDM